MANQVNSVVRNVSEEEFKNFFGYFPREVAAKDIRIEKLPPEDLEEFYPNALVIPTFTGVEHEGRIRSDRVIRIKRGP